MDRFQVYPFWVHLKHNVINQHFTFYAHFHTATNYPWVEYQWNGDMTLQ